jgi:hypothetical protein
VGHEQRREGDKVTIKCACGKVGCKNSLFVSEGTIFFQHEKLGDGKEASMYLDPNGTVQLIMDLKRSLEDRTTLET